MIASYVWLEKFVPGLLFVAIFVAMLLEIGFRAVLRTSITWNTEFCRYALVWVAFVGSVYVRREGKHIQVVFLHEYLARHNFRIALFLINLFRCLAGLAFWIFLAWFGYRLSARTVRFYSSAMAISQYWLYFATVLCGVPAAIMEAGRIWRLFTGRYREPGGGPGEGDGEKPEVLV
ncbi:MAG: TRAP transporter small permease [Planctomycetota bacterium]|jgi:C4-dicarboxylate transporter DctQ subunit|nr:TRAP transporter small permease [Planctomycetota bacterium]